MAHGTRFRMKNPELVVLFFIFLIILLSELRTPNFGFLYAQEKLRINGTLKINSTAADQRHGLLLRPQNTTPTCNAAYAGRVYYSDTANQPYYCNGSAWIAIGNSGQDKVVASKIVAAANSLDTTCVAGNCTNRRADYTCNGTADQGTINYAVNATGVNGGAIYLLEGTYNITGAINLDNGFSDGVNDSGKAIIGTGAGTLLNLVGNVIDAIYAINIDRILISQLRIDGNNTGVGSNYGIQFNNVNNSTIENVWVANITGGAGIDISSGSNNLLSGNYIQDIGTGGWPTDGIVLSSCNNNILSGNQIQGRYVGIKLKAGNNNNILSGNNIQGIAGGVGQGIAVGGYGSGSCNNNTLSGNNIQGTTGTGIAVEGYSGGSSNNNILSGNNIQGNTDMGIYVYRANNNLFSGNQIQGNNNTGIYVAGTVSVPSNNNLFFGNLISDNGGTGNYDGIFIDSNTNNTLLSSNLLYDSGGSGQPIEIYNSSKNTYLVGNFISSWPAASANIIDSGTNTTYTQKEKITLERKSVLTVSGNPLTPTLPTSYQPIEGNVPGVRVNTISSGKAVGDMLILEGTDSTNTVIIQATGNVKLYGGSSHTLGQDDVLTLIWSDPYWIEQHWADNSP